METGDEVLQVPAQYVLYFTEKMQPHIRTRNIDGQGWTKPHARAVMALLEMVTKHQKTISVGRSAESQIGLDADGCYLLTGGKPSPIKQYFGLVRQCCPAVLQIAVPPSEDGCEEVSFQKLPSIHKVPSVRKVPSATFDSDTREKMLRNTFDALDTDGNGVLSRMELMDMLRKLSPVKKSSIASIIDQFDADDDEALSFEEFKEWMSKDAHMMGCVKKAMHDYPSSIQAAFRVWDENGDGSISKRELAQIMKRLNPAITKSQCDAMISVMDKDNNGKIDYSEFVSFLFPPAL
eukprot:TRINITY_DN20624_c0_g1_i1.p1 TRINITY_DN20624_c0_g1~~TRINITY_DN20624_c0_g1_i1.p1  ORF type:complete len:292 (-),score=48.44 TRINITY_DN20624_c0_g1_i1:679-1554(-)